MKIWTVTANDDNGLPAPDIYTSQADAVNACRDWVASYWGAWMGEGVAMPDDWNEAHQMLSDQAGFLDSISLGEHDIADPDQTRPEAQAYRDAAKRQHHREGECEIDDNATVSFGDDAGAYVQAWIWVPAADAGLEADE